MRTELADLIEHLERFRAVTLRVFDTVDDEDLGWRPGPEQYSLGQQLLHIAQAEDMYAQGLFEGNWNYDTVRFPPSLPDTAELQGYFMRVREFTMKRMGGVTSDDLSRIIDIPGSPLEHTLRSWLWFLVEHEMHHKAQISVYLRLMGRIPPFYAQPLEAGDRPDIKAREELGGY